MCRTPSLNGRTRPANWDSMFQARPLWGNGGSAPRSLHGKLKITAACEGVSLNAFMTSVLAEAVGKERLIERLAGLG